MALIFFAGMCVSTQLTAVWVASAGDKSGASLLIAIALINALLYIIERIAVSIEKK